MEKPEEFDPFAELPFTREDLLRDLRSNWEGADAQRELQAWTQVMEREADRDPDNVFGRVNLEIKRAQLYSEAGLPDLAKEAWTDAEILAENTGGQDLIDLVASQRKASAHAPSK